MSFYEEADFTHAEAKLLECVRMGEHCVLGETKPDVSTPENTIRACVLLNVLLNKDLFEGKLEIRGAYIDGAVILDGVTKLRPLHLTHCFISERLSFGDAETRSIALENVTVASLCGNSARIDGDLFIRRCNIAESLELFGAEITGTLSCTGTRLGLNRDDTSVNLITASIGGKLEFNGGFSANGTIFIDDSIIEGIFDCSRAFLSASKSKHVNPSAPWEVPVRALSAYRARISGTLNLRETVAHGELSFTGAEIGGDVDCRGGTFETPSEIDPITLRFTRIKVGGNVYIGRGLRSSGKVEFNGASISGNVNCAGGQFSVPYDPKPNIQKLLGNVTRDALSFVNARIGGCLFLAPASEEANVASSESSYDTPAVIYGSLDLKGANIRIIADSRAAWPKPTNRKNLHNVIYLDGLEYERFAGKDITAKDRIRWLKYQPTAHLGRDFRPQPFEQLMTVLRNMGHRLEAGRVGIARERYFFKRALSQWREAPHSIPLVAILYLIKGFFIDHGYRPRKVVGRMLLVAIICAFYYNHAEKQGVFAPSDSQVLLDETLHSCRVISPEGNITQVKALVSDQKTARRWTACLEEKLPEHPRFDPMIYSLKILLPFLDVFKEKSWVPMWKEVEITVPTFGKIVLPASTTQIVVLFETVFGGLASVFAIAALTGLIRTD